MDTGDGEAKRFEITLLQWGHGVDAVDTYVNLDDTSPTAALQWGHGVDAVDTFRSNGRRLPLKELQWGHGVDAVDT